MEEKADVEPDFELPYSYRFHELAEKPASDADQVKDSVLSMISTIVKRTPFGEVLQEELRLKNPKTFRYIINELAGVSFYDCSLDSKGAAFEYFVRATLKGKKLGQYFTPRDLVKTMVALVGERKIVNAVISGQSIKVLDPACGTGGFLVYLMQDALSQITAMLMRRDITRGTFEKAKTSIKEKIFFGSDANDGVAASSKMNMIIAGDGHTNIKHEDSLALSAKNWKTKSPDCDLILTNPPFGTSETDSLTPNDLSQFPIRSSKGQHLFLQKMTLTLKPGEGEFCTVIDEGVINTESAASLRRWLLAENRLKAVVSLPDETFKPNKINVKSSLLYFERRATPDVDFEESYKITVCRIDNLGYAGSGEKIRGFRSEQFLSEIASKVLDQTGAPHRKGYNWEAFDIASSDVASDPSCRFDFKYWNSDTRKKIRKIRAAGGKTIAELNLIRTLRGKSPSADDYVDDHEGFAAVIKAGSNISRFGKIVLDGADWIEKSIYDELQEQSESTGQNQGLIEKGDVLLSSTGDGTLGKCAVFDLDIPAIADGHVTIIRTDPKTIDPYYLCDYLRAGFGAEQIERLYTGSTGMIELTPAQVDSIVVDLRETVKVQSKMSKRLREIEAEYLVTLDRAERLKASAPQVFS